MNQPQMPASQDPLGAFVPGPQPRLPGAVKGPLVGLTFAAKDLYDVAGFVTGCGNPDYAARQRPATRHAWAVERLLAAGASLVGKTITDEFAFSMNGQNFHYGTPTNSNAPGRLPGGSSSGSAAAVAGGLCDTALGSDTGGSVRIPASFCGLYGLRPTHGAISLEGVALLAPSFDTVGWFTREAELLRRVGEVLLPEDAGPTQFRRLLLAEEAFALSWPAARDALAPLVTRLEQRVARREAVTLGEPGGGLPQWMQHFRTLQGHEIQRTAGVWVAAEKPRLGPDIQERFDWSATITDAAAEAATAARAAFRARLDELLGEDALLVLPSVPGPAPSLATPPADLADWRLRVLTLTCIAGLAGLPQVSLPLAQVDSCPLGLSLIAPRGRDRALLAFAERFVTLGG